MNQLKAHGLNDLRLRHDDAIIYELVVVSDDKYIADHFENGKRVLYLSDRNLALKGHKLSCGGSV